ncbi:MAG: hypothetical protein NWP64_08170, partial [Maribacter sp.]|nr:hypothetical protein [Maribacter sp.]
YQWAVTVSADHPTLGALTGSGNRDTEEVADASIIMGAAAAMVEPDGTIHESGHDIVPNLDGTYDFSIRYTVINDQNDAGTGTLANSIELNERDYDEFYNNMPINVMTFPANSVGGNLVVNGNFNGSAPLIGGVSPGTGDNNLVSSGTLDPDEEDYFEVTMNVGPINETRNGNRNTIRDNDIYGTDTNGLTVRHEYTDGVDASRGSADGPALSCLSGLWFTISYEADFTTVDKNVISVANAASGTSDNYDITYQVDITADNANNVNIYRLSALDNLAATLGSDFIGVVNAPIVTNINATSPPAPNTGFDGSTGSAYGDGIDLLAGNNTNILAPGESIRITYTVEVHRPSPTTDYNTEVDIIGDNSINGKITEKNATNSYQITYVAPDVSISDASAVDEGNNNVFTITSSASVPQDIVFNIAYANITTTAADYNSTLTTVTLPANSTSVTFNVATTDDLTIEPTETYSATISYASGSGVNIVDDEGIGTITDNDKIIE